ncbi:MAG: S1C family serine protease [Pirellulales bacterium]
MNSLKTIALLVICLGTARTSAANESAAQLYTKLYNSCVEVVLDRHNDGSGSFVSAEGHVLTAAHIFQREYKHLEVVSPSLGRFTAQLIALDIGHDIALLKIEPSKQEIPFLKLASKSSLPGEDTYLYGTPLFRRNVMAKGMIASNQTNYEYLGKFYVEETHITVVTTKGTSGGPWVNPSGEIIGVQSGIMSLKGAPQGVAFASPLFAIKRVLSEKKNAQTQSLLMAIEEIGEQPFDYLKKLPSEVNGLVARLVKKNGPADKAGIKDGMVITQINGKNVTQRNVLLKQLRQTKPGSNISLTVVHSDGSNPRTVTITPVILEKS